MELWEVGDIMILWSLLKLKSKCGCLFLVFYFEDEIYDRILLVFVIKFFVGVEKLFDMLRIFLVMWCFCFKLIVIKCIY